MRCYNLHFIVADKVSGGCRVSVVVAKLSVWAFSPTRRQTRVISLTGVPSALAIPGAFVYFSSRPSICHQRIAKYLTNIINQEGGSPKLAARHPLNQLAFRATSREKAEHDISCFLANCIARDIPRYSNNKQPCHRWIGTSPAIGGSSFSDINPPFLTQVVHQFQCRQMHPSSFCYLTDGYGHIPGGIVPTQIARRHLYH